MDLSNCEIETYCVDYLPIMKSYADRLGLVELINDHVRSEMEVDSGSIVLGLVLDSLTGRSPLYHLEDFFKNQDTELLLGKKYPPKAFCDDNVGRVLDRIYQSGTMKIFSSIAIRAGQLFDFDKKYVHFDTTSKSVYGDYLRTEKDSSPFHITHGYSKDKRPDLKQFIFSLLCSGRNVPLFASMEDGNASDKRLNNDLLSWISSVMASHGIDSDSFIYIADSAMVSPDNLKALGDNMFISRLPANYKECSRVIKEAVEADSWEEIGSLAQSPPTKNRPIASYKLYETQVNLHGNSCRAIVIHSSSHDKRRQKRIDRELESDHKELQTQTKALSQKLFYCRADAESAWSSFHKKVRSEFYEVCVQIQECPKYKRGRVAKGQSRQIEEMHYQLVFEIKEKPSQLASKQKEAGCFVLLSNVPATGPMAHSGMQLLKAYKQQHGIEQNFSFLKDPVIVNGIFLKKGQRIEALGLILLIALLIWRLMEFSMRAYIKDKQITLTGLDKKPTDRPTTYMMTTKFKGIIILKVGWQRKINRSLDAIQKSYLDALGISEDVFVKPVR